MESFNELYNGDIKRYGGEHIDDWIKKYLYYFRKSSTCTNSYLARYYRFRFRKLSEKHGMEIPARMKIGKGLYLGHPYNITIHGTAKLGNNINLSKGVTIGQENRGKRAGVPTIGNKVWIGINATIVGNITIGDDVLIAPNSYVNCDIPSHSIAIGNPCKIIPRENATENYINFTV